MDKLGTFVDTDILVVGGGAGGLIAALSAKRNSPLGTRVTILDAAGVGRTGHAAFSNAWFLAALPQDDLDAIVREIISGSDWVADQDMIRRTIYMSHERLRDFEGIGMVFPRGADGEYERRPTRGLNHARLVHPEGGGLAFCWKLRRALEDAGVQIIDRLFITGLMRRQDGSGIAGAVGVHHRSGEFYALRAKSTIIATNAPTFRAGFARDISGTGCMLALQAGAAIRNAEFSYLRPSTPKFYFEGITFAVQDGARFINGKGEQFMQKYEPVWGDRADVPRIARAMALEREQGNSPFYLDFSLIPEDMRSFYFDNMVEWMQMFRQKLKKTAKMDMFDKTPYYPLNQMPKMGIRTGTDCRTDVPGLLAAGLAQAGCANHFAGFHIGMCIGSGWTAGESAGEDVQTMAAPGVDPAEVAELRRTSLEPLRASAKAESDKMVHDIQNVMFKYDVAVWKHADRLRKARAEIAAIKDRYGDLLAPHVHELVRLKETQAMVLTAETILEASMYRRESRLSHFREDYDRRDDADWLRWVDLQLQNDQLVVSTTPIPTPLVPVSVAS